MRGFSLIIGFRVLGFRVLGSVRAHNKRSRTRPTLPLALVGALQLHREAVDSMSCAKFRAVADPDDDAVETGGCNAYHSFF